MKTQITTLLFMMFTLTAISQTNQGKIKGQVFDKENGEPLPFVKILVDSSAMAQTDFDGYFSISVAPGTHKIESRFVGMENHILEGVIVKADQITMVKIEMESSAQTLQAVQVVHYEVPMIQKDVAKISYSSNDISSYQQTAPGVSRSKPKKISKKDAIAKMPRRNIEGGEAVTIDGVKEKKKRKKRKKKEKSTEDKFYEYSYENGLAGEASDMDPIPSVGTEYERYNPFNENEWVKANEEKQSTFSIDVDNASYTNFRRFVKYGQLPPKDAIRVEEWLNFFNYELNAPEPSDPDPLKIESEIAACPWAPEDDLLMIKMQGRNAPKAKKDLPASNLVFLVDVSGSMGSPNKLPLVQQSMKTLLESLRPEDNIAIVTYAGNSTIALEPTSGADQEAILAAINSLSTGGGTHGSQGLKTAYELAEKNLDPEANNRVIIATDGDWNIGITGDAPLKKLIEKKRESGIFLSVLGFGMYNLNDRMMEMLADNGNGNYAYVDEEKEAIRLFKSEFAGTMHTIAKDVKIQITFDPEEVAEYRLLGYENRVLENWQFDDDAVDAGDLGMGQNVIAFYQISRIDGKRGSLGKLDFRYKPLDSDESLLLSHEFSIRVNEASTDFNFASCVIEFAMCLRESEYRGDAQMERAIKRGRANLGDPKNALSYEKRVEFVGIGDNTSDMWEEYVVEEAPELQMQTKPELKLYPNPASEYTTVEVPKDLKGSWSIQLFGMNGQLHKVEHFQDTNSGRIDITELDPGNYIIKVYQAGFNFGYLKLVKT